MKNENSKKGVFWSIFGAVFGITLAIGLSYLNTFHSHEVYFKYIWFFIWCVLLPILLMASFYILKKKAK